MEVGGVDEVCDAEEELDVLGKGEERAKECDEEGLGGESAAACERRGNDQNGRSTDMASIVPPPKYAFDPEVSRAEPESQSLTTRQPSPVG